MPASNRDPYKLLGVSPRASDAELHAAYRRLVQLHHPDHNGGSLEATRRFEEIQVAYAEIRQQRERASGSGRAPGGKATPRGDTSRRAGSPPPGGSPPRTAADPNLEARLADIERELREAREASERARRAARAEAAAGYKRPSDEELGYVTTDDSLGKILADARTQLSDRFAEGRGGQGGERVSGERGGQSGERVAEGRDRQVGERVADLLEELAAKLRGGAPGGSRGDSTGGSRD
jgi:curved DNA-binding protein CbpA